MARFYTGFRRDAARLLSAVDVAVLPSYREAQGLAILEAMALRRPVVATLDTGCGEHPWLDGVVRTDVKLGTQPIGYVDDAGVIPWRSSPHLGTRLRPPADHPRCRTEECA